MMLGKGCCSLVFDLTRLTCYKTGTITNTHPTRQLHNKRTKTPQWTEPSTNAFPPQRAVAYLLSACLHYTCFG